MQGVDGHYRPETRGHLCLGRAPDYDCEPGHGACAISTLLSLWALLHSREWVTHVAHLQTQSPPNRTLPAYSLVEDDCDCTPVLF